LQVPYRFLFPAALFFIAVGVYSTNNSLFEVSEVLVFGLIGAVFVALDFPVAPILLGYVLGPMVEENFRRALLLSHGNMAVFVEQPISACFIAASTLLILLQAFFSMRASMRKRKGLKSNVLPQVPTMNDAQRDNSREPPLARADQR
jgi:TctA family transporter